MADIQSNIQVNIDATEALAQLKALQRQLSLFNTSLSKSTGAAAKAQADLQQNLINSINATGKFNASLKNIKSSAESFTESLEKNKFSTREYFRFAAGSTKAFSKIFKTEFDTIGKVAEERVKTMQTQYIKMGRDANGALKSIAVRPLTLDMKELGTQVALTSQKQQLFGQLLKQGSTNLLNFGKNTQWAGRQLMVGFTIPLTIFGSKASQVFMDLEKQAIRFKRVYGEMFTTQAETQKALDQVRLLAEEFTKYGIAVADTMKMAADAAAQGKIGADLMAQVAQATRLSVLGQVEQQQALETTMSLQNAFGYSAEQLASKINFLNAVENQTVVGIEDLTVAIPKAGPVVQQLGGSVEDLAFFLTAMKEGGINASEGANALKSGLASLINPTDKASGMLADLGINIEGIVKRNKGNVAGVVTEFAFALDRLTDLDRAKAIEQLFGKFQFARLSTLFQNVIKDGNQASRVLDLMGNSTEELAILSERELKTLENATGTKFKKSMENLKASIAPVGEQFLKAVTPIAEFLTKVLDKFNNLGEGGKKALILLATIFGAIGPVFLMTFGLIANGAANIIKLFGTMRNGFLGLGKQSDRLAFQTQYMSSEQVEAATIAASLDQAHAKLIQTFNQEAGAVGALTAAYQKGIVAANNFAIQNPGSMMPRRKFAEGGWVPGSGNKDTVPAILTPGEFVVNKKAAQENKGFLQRLNKGGFVKRIVGTPARKQFLGMPLIGAKKAKDSQSRQFEADKIATETWKSPRVKTIKPTEYAQRISPSTGHSFPSSSVGGIYKTIDGREVFVKPMPSEKAAIAEMRANEIAKDVHGLIAPKSKLVLIKDPNDPTGHRQYFALESPVDKRLATPPQKFNKQETFTQLVASLLRGDKDLSPGNIGGKVLVDPGTAGVFSRASGSKNEFATSMPSMAEQAMVNLLGVKGGAKKFFAQATSNVARSMTPQEYDMAVKNEIKRTIPLLQNKIRTMGLSAEEVPAYEAMLQRLQNGLNTDWSKFQPIHANAGRGTPVNNKISTRARGANKKARIQWDGRYCEDGCPTEKNACPLCVEGNDYRGYYDQEDSIVKKLNKGGFVLRGRRAGGTNNGAGGTPARGTKKKTGIQWDGRYCEDGCPTEENACPLCVEGNDYRGYYDQEDSKNTTKRKRGKTQSLKNNALKINVPSYQTSAYHFSDSKNSIHKPRVWPVINEGIIDQKIKSGDLKPGDKGRIKGMAGKKLYTGYTILGPSPFNALSSGIKPGKNNPASFVKNYEPYPLTVNDLQNVANQLENIPTEQQTFATQKVLLQLYSELDQVKNNSSLYQKIIKERYTMAGAFASVRASENTEQVLSDFYNVKQALSAVFDKSYNPSSTSATVNNLLNNADQMWSKQLSSEFPMLGAFDQNRVKGGKSRSAQTHGEYDTSIVSHQRMLLKAMQTNKNTTYDEWLTGWGVASKNLPIANSKTFESFPSSAEKYLGKAFPGKSVTVARNYLPIVPRKNGTPLRYFANGGPVPGYGEKDTVPALLTPGEFVVNKKATQENGPILEAMNAGGVAKRKFGTPVQRYQQGGFVNDPNDPFADVGVPIDAGSAQKAGKTIGQGILSVGKRLGQIAASSIVPTAGVRQDLQDEYIESEIQRKRLNASIPSIGAQMAPKADVRQMTMAEFKAQNAPQSRGRFMSMGRRFGGSADNAAALQQRDRNMMARVNGASFALMGLTNAASMLGDGMADKVAPVTTALSGLTMAMSMIQGPKSAIAVAVGAVAGTYFWLKKQNEALLAKTIETTAAMGAGEQAMRKLAETTGKVSAGEVMDRRRSQKLSQFQIQPGKKTFGQSFVEGETGKQMVTDFGQSIKDIGQQAAQSQLVTQLATAITSGIMTPAQARSVAANIGEQLGNRSFGINVNAQLLDLIGAEGENLLKDPVALRVKLIEDSKAGISKSMDATKNATRFTGGTIGRTVGFGLAGGAGGALAGLVAGSTVAAGMAATGAAVGSAVPLIGTAIGAVAGLAIGAMIGLKKRNEAIAKATGASVAMQKIALEQSQELLDSYDVENQKKIQQLETEGKLAEAAKLRSQYEEGRTKLLAQNATLNDQILNSFKNAPGGKVQHLMLKGAEKAAVAKYKDTPMAPIAEAAVGSIQSMGLNREQQYLLNVQMSSGQLDPAQVMNFASLFQGDAKGASAVVDITTRFGGTTLNELTSVTSLFVDRTGKPLDSVQKAMFVNVQSAKTPEAAQKLIDFYNNLGKTGQVLDLDIVGNYVVNNPVGAELLQDTISKIQAQKGKIDMKVTTKLLGASPASLDALNSNLDYYNNLPDEQKKVYLTVLATATETFDLNSQDAKNFMNETGMQVGNARRPGRFVEGVTAKDVSTSMGTRAAVQATKVSTDKTKGVKDGTDGTGGQRNTMFDDLLKRLKLVQDSSINAMGGLKELKRVMLGKGAISLTKFEGIDQKLLKNGKVSKEFLDFVDSLGPEGLQKDLKQFVTIGKNGIATLNEAGKALMGGMAAAKLGEFDSANKTRIAEIKNEVTATSKLIKAGFTFAEAQELAKDSTIALAIANNQLDDKGLQKLRKSTQQLTKAQKDYEKIQKTAMMDEMDGQKTRFEMVQKYIVLQEKLIENQYAQQKATLESKQDANNYALDVISRQEEKVNKEYDKQVEYLDQIQAKQEQINQLQQQRLGLAQALSQGDMAGAAQAIQSIRQEEAAAQIEARKKAVEKSRQQALGNITYGGRNRQQIEDDNKQISNSLTDITEKIRVAKEGLDKQLKETVGMTRVQIEGAVSGITAALDAGIDPNDKNFLGNILKGVMGEADATKTSLMNTTTEIKNLIAELDKAKAKYDNDKKFGDQNLTKDTGTGTGTGAGTPPASSAPNASSTKNGVMVGSQWIELPKPTKPSITAAERARQEFLKTIIPNIRFNSGGMVPKYFANGGYSRGTDTIPAMLTAGEYVVKKSAVDSLGINTMNSINNGKLPVNSNSVYNYGISVNVNNSNANPNDIARTVINQIKQIDSQRIRSYR